MHGIGGAGKAAELEAAKETWSMRIMATLLLIGILSVWATEALADGTVQLVSGAKVRMTATSERFPFTGRLLALDDEALVIQKTDHVDTTRVHRDAITSLAVSAGRHSRSRGALIGAGLGAVTGILIGAASGSGSGSAEFGIATSRGVSAFALAVFFAPIGALVGAAIPPGERWEEVDVGQVRVGILLDEGSGAGAGVAVSF